MSKIIEEKIDTLQYTIGIRKTESDLSEKTLILFHGFGQTAAIFDPLMIYLSNKYNCIALDLFFHGNSDWKKKEILTDDDWNAVLIAIINKYDLHRFEILGYSLGARFALNTFYNMPSRVVNMYLIAPEGLYNNMFYDLVLKNKLTRYIFKRTMLHPEWFVFILKKIRKFKLMNPLLVRFAELNLNSKQNRLKIYKTWVYFKELITDFGEVRFMIKKHGVNLSLILAKNDAIIENDKLKLLTKKIKNLQIHEYNCSHNQLINHLPKFFENFIKRG